MLSVDSKLKYKSEFNNQSYSSTPVLPELSFQEVEEYFSDLWSEQTPLNENIQRVLHSSNSFELSFQTMSSSSSKAHLYNTGNHVPTQRLSTSPINNDIHKMNVVENKRRRRWKTMARSMIPKAEFFMH
ncbi:unnamed protein product [Trichobilharzia regenti]|uniref:BHLH domain-containing protein n=1 Tax=Trichobilharzia regenti TaxID=157069 RepID=A0A183W644_TRIRE|nr:unnamed protein product [Trichobilharzia regenti]VDQ03643.1 unnamed protein product [Trichobilharzia regenti]